MGIMKSSGASQGKWEFEKLMLHVGEVRVSDQIRRSMYRVSQKKRNFVFKGL